MKPVLLFDLGDTLIQYYRREEFPPLLRAGIHAAKEALERLGHDVPADSEIERGVAAENYEAKNSRVRPLHKRLGRIFAVAPCVSKEEWLPICRAFLTPIFSIAKIYEDTLPALDAYLADGYRVGILSNCPWGSPSEPWFEELRRHGLSTRCEVAIFCSDVGWRKPAQPMFRRALDHFGCKPEECLFVGDNPRWDIVGARRANMISVLIDRMGHVDVSSGIVIRSLFDLKPVLERLDWELTTTTGISHPDGGDELKNTDERDQQREAPRNRLSRLSEASLRINESLDLDTVLQEILDSARSLTDAWCGVIVSVDDKGQVEDFLASGLTDEETQQLFAMPEGLKIFEYLTTIPGPLRVPDFASHLRSQGLSEFHPPTEISARAYLGAPIRHRGETVGNIYLAKSEPGQEFTREDEETLVMFASQAALVIGNVRKYRDERRARADLETLIDTSPIGVVVFDVRTGAPVSFNREARRIIGGLQTPGYPVEQLLDVLTFQRADGSEVSLDKVSLAQALSTGETVRAEEIVMQTPDGRSVTTLVNATPIRSQDGEVESFVVTLQDLTSLEELGRLRAEFLGMVSHELRVPLTSIKGSAITLLDDSSDLDPAELRQFHQIIVDQVEHMREMIGDLLDVARIATGTLPVHPEPTEIASLVDRARNTFLSSGGRNNLDLDLALDLPSVMADRPRIIQVLGNLLSNAAKHSLESSVIRVTAVREDCHVAVTVADEGTGISAEQLPRLFRKFSRAVDEDGERKIGDSGLGLAICKGIVEAHGGRIWAESDGLGQGARFTFTIPVVKDTGSKATTQSPQRAAYSRQEASEESRILVVDDDPQALRFIRNALSEAAFTPIVTADPKEAILLMREQKPHLVLLDMVLPDSDGIDLMKDILRIADVPVIFVSGYGKDQVIAQAFEQGVADYIVKPFSPTELVARVRAALRRQADPYRVGSLEPYVLGELTIDYAERRVTVAGQPVELTATEYQLLFELSVNAGRVVTYDQLLRRVWGLTNASDVRLIRTPVRNLRRKLGDDADSPAYIFTELRVGYRMPKGQEPRQETN